jgi:transposase-like protein
MTRGLSPPDSWSNMEAFKRQIVAATLESGSSVSMVARQQLFKWRR